MADSSLFSPDGKWLWTGTEWIPAPPTPGDARATGTRATPSPATVNGASLRPAPPIAPRTGYGWIFKQARRIRWAAAQAATETGETKTVYRTTYGVLGTTTREKEEETTWSFLMGLAHLLLLVLAGCVYLAGWLVRAGEQPIRSWLRRRRPRAAGSARSSSKGRVAAPAPPPQDDTDRARYLDY